MSYDYEIELDGTRVDTIVRWVRFLRYTAGAKRGSDVVAPYRHGELHIPDKLFSASEILLEVGLPATSNDAAAQALSDLTAFFAQQVRPVLSQNDPHRGNIRASVELLTEPTPTQDRFTYLFVLRNAKGFWEDETLSQAASGNPPSVTTGGDRPVHDAVLSFSGTGYLEHTDDLGNLSRITIESGAGGTTPYVVDIGKRTVKDSAGTPVNKDEFLVVSKPHWMVFSPGAAQSFTSDVSVAVDWRNKWA